MSAGENLTRVAVYERTLRCRGWRVWENVHDWEHLPWLHASSFASIALEDEGSWGWRARIGLQGGAEILLELVIEEDEPRYVSRTLEGANAGSEIWTTVHYAHGNETRVEVEFLLPDVPPERVEALGKLYTELYTRLWDEDESMILRRQNEDRRSVPGRSLEPVVLGTLADVKSRLPLIVEFWGIRFRVVEHGGELVAHAVACPHWLGPLDEAPVEDGRIVCPWHGYTFDVLTGVECTGKGLKLRKPPRVEVDAARDVVRLVRG